MTSQAAADKITRARSSLILNQPFFATLTFKLDIQEDPQHSTAWTDGETLGYNPEFIESLTVDQAAGLLAHEVMHLACLHHTRRGGRDSQTWNEAGDYAINGELMKAGFILPPDGLHRADFDGMSAEEIHRQLDQEKQDQQGDQGNQQQQGAGQQQPGQDQGPQQGQQPGPTGEVKDSPAEKKGAEAKQKQAIEQALAVAKSAGTMPGDLERLIREAQPPAVDWRDVLQRFVEMTAKQDYTFTRPNPRYSGTGFFLPGLKSESMPPLAVAIDTSGSIAQGELDQFAAEIQAIMDTWKTQINVIFCDSQIKNRQTFEAGEPVKLEAKGGGGTRFAPVMEEIEQAHEQPAALIYLTDMQAHDLDRISDPGPPVLWIATRRRHPAPPFGEVVSLV